MCYPARDHRQRPAGTHPGAWRSVVPHDLQGYSTAGSALAGTLTGLLFVAISLRYDAIIAGSARMRATATSAFIALADALVVSLWALLPGADLGFAAGVVGLLVFGTIVVGLGRAWQLLQPERTRHGAATPTRTAMTAEPVGRSRCRHRFG